MREILKAGNTIEQCPVSNQSKDRHRKEFELLEE